MSPPTVILWCCQTEVHPILATNLNAVSGGLVVHSNRYLLGIDADKHLSHLRRIDGKQAVPSRIPHRGEVIGAAYADEKNLYFLLKDGRLGRVSFLGENPRFSPVYKCHGLDGAVDALASTTRPFDTCDDADELYDFLIVRTKANFYEACLSKNTKEIIWKDMNRPDAGNVVEIRTEKK
jgi:hypothetical protein